ncbi:hypothetical protein J2X92_000352 [Variovorax paradoxus]|nr:hypothetical protein [Variovorax paradoxus]
MPKKKDGLAYADSVLDESLYAGAIWQAGAQQLAA